MSLLALLLAACGGGGGGDAPAAATAAQTTTASAATTMASTDPTPAAASAGGGVATPAADPAPAPDTAAVAAADAAAAEALAAQVPADQTIASVLSVSAGDAQRTAAAVATAQSGSNACNAIRPFYWEIGSSGGALASGSVTAPGNGLGYGATTAMPVASASKWLYSAYVVQKRGGKPSASDLRFLTLESGYVGMGSSGCAGSRTVDECLATGTNGSYYAAADGRYDYDGGHMQKHASLDGLGAADDTALRKALQGQLGADVPLAFSRPLLAGGVVTTPAGYARVLRKMMTGELKIGALLGTGKVCTNPLTCGADKAIHTPVPSSESWHYSLGHWVEDDPVVGDGAFSSAGALGFYPWIDATKTIYGIVARAQQEGSGQGFASAQCGRLIRKAWKTGLAQ